VVITHPVVSEAATCGVPDELRGQVVVACIILKPWIQSSDKLKKEIIWQVRKVTEPT
jgi:acetyl-CoA synthetase